MVKHSSHARKRMLERSISEKDVDNTINHPTSMIETRYGRKAEYAPTSGGNYIVVIFEASGEDFIVVTAVKVNRERVRRYGFGGI